MFKQIFEEGIELQKARFREERAYAKEVRQQHQRKHRDELESMENYYKDQVTGPALDRNSTLTARISTGSDFCACMWLPKMDVLYVLAAGHLRLIVCFETSHRDYLA